MQHRHITTQTWSKTAIDSAIECGDLPDWRELFHAVAHDRRLAHDVLDVINAHPIEGGAALARHLVATLWPDLQ